MYTVFLTGGLASGKSTVAERLAAKGATILDLDQIAKEEQESESVMAELRAEFGNDIVDSQGQLDRRLLAERAFASPEKTARLNEICWPPTIQRLSEYLVGGSCQPIEHGAMVVVQIPLLVEAQELIPLADEVVTVSVPPEMRLDRAINRGMDKTDAAQRLARQVTDEQREAIADTVFYNSGSLAELYQDIDEWYEQRMAGRLL
ncbi:MAG: dephospho-CoA kinase [Coriobacteriia bacterium]|nr:dephospho-CoA kinase [Coriobacteriia bacterium]